MAATVLRQTFSNVWVQRLFRAGRIGVVGFTLYELGSVNGVREYVENPKLMNEVIENTPLSNIR